MRIVLFGGFLGSGKTTVIRNLIGAIQRETGEKIAVVENEIGACGVDDLVLQQSNVEVTALTGGCVCCQITGSLIAAVQEIERRIDPDWLMVELSGIAYLNGIRDTLQNYRSSTWQVNTVAVIDAARWGRLLRAAESLIRNQVMGGDLIVINKCDLSAETERIASEAKEMNHTGRCVWLSSLQGDGSALLTVLQVLQVSQGSEG